VRDCVESTTPAEESFARAIRKPFTYTGRDTRAQYGWFFLTLLVICFLAGIVDAIVTPPAAGKEFGPIAGIKNQ
jgi:uncharacterized membrane protein YhaH (DUF805 family)